MDHAGHSVSGAPPCTVAFAVCALYDQIRAHRSGSTVPIKLSLRDSDGLNVSSPSIVVTATGVRQICTRERGR